MAIVLVFAALPALAQGIPGERLPQPRAIEIWQPSSPQPAPTDGWPALYTQQPVGFDAGPFKVYPSITVGAFHDDNVFATNADRRSDWAFFVRPEIGFRTAGQNYAVATQAFVEGRRYGRFTSEDQINGAAESAGIFQPDADTQFRTRLKFLHAHESRGSGESLLTSFDKPVAYNQFEAAGALNKRHRRVWTSLGVAGAWVNYQEPTIGGIPVDQSYRNGNVTVASARGGYVVAPLTSIFIEGAGNRRNFGVDIFDSTGYRVVGGVLLEEGPGARVKGELFAGYMNQNYVGATFLTVSTWTYGAALAVLLAPNLTAALEGRREAKESALAGGVSVVETLAGGRVDYRIQPNVVIGGGVTYLDTEFLGAGRTDHTWSPLASLKYFASPKVTLGVDYRYVTFDSSGIGVLSYYRNVVLFSINGRI